MFLLGYFKLKIDILKKITNDLSLFYPGIMRNCLDVCVYVNKMAQNSFMDRYHILHCFFIAIKKVTHQDRNINI